MLSPESFTRTHKRHVTDVVRVSLERKGIIGFIETHEGMTLLEARQLIWENVENAPCDFQFVLDDGVPVSARQESTQRVLQFYPCVKIRECKKPRSSSPNGATSPTSQDMNEYASPASNSSTEKISVWTASGDEFTAWISEEYTFQQLRRDAARYWNLSASQVALTDSDGCLWPEQAKILAVMGIEELLQRKIVLESKAGGTPLSSTLKSRSASSLARTVAVLPTRRRSSMDSTLSPQRTSQNWQDVLMGSAPSNEMANPVEELWRVFTFYCVNGDSLDLECIRAHQFNRLLRDACVLGAAVTPAMADIIYTSETKGKPQASGKMNFDEFLNALVKVALARHRKSSSKLLQRSVDTQEEDELFHRLVAECILPRASRWPTHAWEQQTQQLRSHDIVGFVSKFLDPLLDIYAFYAKNHLLNTTSGVKEFHMAYADYQRFVNDFALANLQISSVEAAQVFVAACASSPIHHAFDGDDCDRVAASPRSLLPGHFQDADDTSDVLSCSSSSSTTVQTVTLAFQKLVQSAEGVVLFLPSAAQVGRLCMSFSAFLDALGRLGLVAFAKTKAGRLNALQSVKAVFHHVSRGLTRSRVLDIVANHGSASIHSGRFYSGSVAFNNKFLDMWRYEGSPDYLAVGNGEENADSAVVNCIVSTPIGSATGKKSTVAGAAANLPLSPSKRLTSSAALFDERVVPNGAGRGREALDRLVRNAFIRNAVASATNTSAATATMVSVSGAGVCEDKEDSIAPASATDDDTSATMDSTHTKTSQPPPPPLLKLKSANDTRSSETDARKSTQMSSGEADRAHSTDSSVVRQPPLRPYLSGGLPLHPNDERALFESILLKGGVFKKYGQWGNPHRRFVWCTKEFDGVFWRPINKKHSLSKDGLAVVSLITVLPGNSQRTRYAFMKHLSDEKSLSRCFSLVAEDRRLDLEADSEASRDLWIQALQFLIRNYRARVPTT